MGFSIKDKLFRRKIYGVFHKDKLPQTRVSVQVESVVQYKYSLTCVPYSVPVILRSQYQYLYLYEYSTCTGTEFELKWLAKRKEARDGVMAWRFIHPQYLYTIYELVPYLYRYVPVLYHCVRELIKVYTSTQYGPYMAWRIISD